VAPLPEAFDGYGYKAGKSDTPPFWRGIDGNLNCSRLRVWNCHRDHSGSELRLRLKFRWLKIVAGQAQICGRPR